MSAEERLQALGLTLPDPPEPVANYVTNMKVDRCLYVSGHGPAPLEGAKLTGKLGDDHGIEEGYVAARQTGLSILATVRASLGSLARVERVVKLLGMVHATPGFLEHPQVINGCSDLFVEVFGEEHGRASRSAVGLGSLPGAIATEIEAIFLIAE